MNNYDAGSLNTFIHPIQFQAASVYFVYYGQM